MTGAQPSAGPLAGVRVIGTDACVTPVLSITEAAADAHVTARGSVLDSDDYLQPGVAPRLSRHPMPRPRRPVAVGRDTVAVLSEAGVDVDALLEREAAVAAGEGSGRWT